MLHGIVKKQRCSIVLIFFIFTLAHDRLNPSYVDDSKIQISAFLMSSRLVLVNHLLGLCLLFTLNLPQMKSQDFLLSKPKL